MKIAKINTHELLVNLLIAFFLIVNISCDNKSTIKDDVERKSREDFIATLKKHLDAVSNRDLESLKSTMSPNGEMQLLLPGSEIIYNVDGFMDYHEEWFQDTVWTFETKIVNTEIGRDLGLGVTEIIYREPERDGEPYFNRMTVSYVLKKIEGSWYIIKDHASSIEKSTDKKE
jgi:ketosteroid isomerase-like protein